MLRKNDFNHRRALNDFSDVDEVAGMDAKISIICGNCGMKVKNACLNKNSLNQMQFRHDYPYDL